MRLCLLALALIGYCFNINSGCCKKRNKTINSDKLGNLGSKKNVPGGGGHNPSKIKVSNDGVSITFSDKIIQLGDNELLANNECNGLVSEYLVAQDKIGKGKCVKIYNIPVTEISLPKGFIIEIDNAIKSSPYLIAIGLYKNGKYYFIVCNGEDCVSLFSRDASLVKLYILSSTGIDNMENMFPACTFTDVSFFNFDTSKVTNMQSMFSGCESLKSLDLSNFNTDKVTDMSNMFNGCKSLENLKLGDNFKSDKVTTVKSMFNMCNNLVELDFNKFNINKFTQVKQRRNLISGCNSLIKIVCCNELNDSLAKHFSNNGFTAVDKKTWVKSTK